jgi:uncharacterized membrane protein
MARALYQAIIISFIAWKVCTSSWSVCVCVCTHIIKRLLLQYVFVARDGYFPSSRLTF